MRACNKNNANSLRSMHISHDSSGENNDEPGDGQHGHPLGDLISVVDIPSETECIDDEATWKKVSYNKNNTVINENTRDDQVITAADTHLVVFGVSTDVTSEQILKYLTDKNISVTTCDLLTKHERPRSLSYKITVKIKDLKRAQNPSTWPEGVGVRMYRPPNENVKKPRKVRKITFKQDGFSTNATMAVNPSFSQNSSFSPLLTMHNERNPPSFTIPSRCFPVSLNSANSPFQPYPSS